MRAAAENQALLKRVDNKKSTHGLNSMRGSVFGTPNRIRTGVTAVKGRCPRPLDDGSRMYCVLLNHKIWHSQPDSNRCYRRERAVS